MTSIPPLHHLSASRFETAPILKKLSLAARKLAELKGVASSIPNQAIVINTLTMQEAKDSSEIENIVTTHDELFQDDLSAAAKEVLRYREALYTGFDAVRGTGLLTLNHLLQVQAVLEQNNAGLRQVPGTTLQDNARRIVYTPPQDAADIQALMGDLERFLNEPALFEADPLIKMALIHHQFESIHPFYDGNGRTGRLLNVLYLVKEGLLDIPVLYLSRHIVRSKQDYYRLLQAVRTSDAWEAWVLYMLTAVEQTSIEAIATIQAIKTALLEAKHHIREQHRKFYSQDLINHLFAHPYTKVEHLAEALDVSRLTATKYLEALRTSGLLLKRKKGRTNYFINQPLTAILTSDAMRRPDT